MEDNKEALDGERMENSGNKLNRHEEKELKRKEREEAERAEKSKIERKKIVNKAIKYGVIALAVLLIVYGVYKLAASSPSDGPYTKTQVHWHSELAVYACGKIMPMPRPVGAGHLGTPLLHTHEDGRIHIEGKIWKKEDIFLGRYMKNIGIDFSSEQISNYKNGDLCDGKPGKVNMFINGDENFDFENWILRDGDKIVMRFE